MRYQRDHDRMGARPRFRIRSAERLARLGATAGTPSTNSNGWNGIYVTGTSSTRMAQPRVRTVWLAQLHADEERSRWSSFRAKLPELVPAFC